MMVFARRLIGSGAVLFAAAMFVVPAFGQAGGGGDVGSGKPADESKMYYELGFSYLMQGDKVRARRLLERAAAAKGQLGDLARLQLIRLLAVEKRKKGESRLPQVRAMLDQMRDPVNRGEAWYAAIQSLYDYGETDASLELALEVPQRFAANRALSSRAAFLAAQILTERRQYAAALEQLFAVVDLKPKAFRAELAESDSRIDDAYYLLARIYLSRGEYYSPRKAYRAIIPFKTHARSPAFQISQIIPLSQRL